jgi:hypothetical protein
MTILQKKKVKKLKKYVRKNWLKESVLADLSVFWKETKTNNGAESWHSTLKDEFPKAHPNLWHFTHKLSDLLTDSKLDLVRLSVHGQIGRPQKTKVKQNRERRRKLEEELRNGEKLPIQFLRAVSYTVDYTHERAVAADEDHSESGTDSEDDEDQPHAAAPAAADNNPVRAANTCPVCLLVRERTYCFVSCGHALFCEGCANTLFANQSHCPTCRTGIQMVIRTYTD